MKTFLVPILALTLASGIPASVVAGQGQSSIRRREPLLDDSNVDIRRSPIVDVVERAKPAVVSIESDVSQLQRGWFGQILEVPADVSGTGVVIYEDGYIVTNNHVISGASKILVHFDQADDDREYVAQLISTRPEEDLALIKIEGDHPFPTIPLSDADPLLGETVIAIGNALRNTHTVSQGIISGLHRDVTVRDSGLKFQGLIQTDASINPGNSGGPLLDITGELIGINTVISAGAENIGFAIPVARVKYVLSTHLLDLAQARAYVGAEIDGNSYEFSEIVRGGPADQAGIRDGDRLVAIEGKPVGDHEAFKLAWLAVQPREDLHLTVKRGGAEKELELTTWNKPDGIVFEHLGILVHPVEFGSSFQRMLQIDRVDTDGPADRIKLQTGDVIAAVRPAGYRSYQVGSPRDLAILIQRLDPVAGTEMEIEVWRDDDGDGRLERDDSYSELYYGTIVLR